MSILTKTKAECYCKFHLMNPDHSLIALPKPKNLTRVYVRYSGDRTIEYTSKYTYVPKRYRDVGLGMDVKHAIEFMKEHGFDEKITQRVTKKQRRKQFFKPIGLFCFDCETFYSNKQIEEMK
jgi:hypothetical protein